MSAAARLADHHVLVGQVLVELRPRVLLRVAVEHPVNLFGRSSARGERKRTLTRVPGSRRRGEAGGDAERYGELSAPWWP